jgi:D-alanine-D-alanine ligase
MVGIPYVGSGPLAHSLALDKVVAKMIFRQQGLPTPDFAVLDASGFQAPDLSYPLIVKPKNEAVSMGIEIVHNERNCGARPRLFLTSFTSRSWWSNILKAGRSTWACWAMPRPKP